MNTQKILTFFVCVFVCACGNSVNTPACDYVVDNLCVIVNDYPLTEEDISMELDDVEKRVNEHFTDGTFSFLDTFAVYPCTVEFVSPDHDKLENHKYRGVTYGDANIYVGYVDAPMGRTQIHSEKADKANAMYVFGHETMHIIAQHYLGASDKDNADHNVPGLFFTDNTSVEYWTYVDTYAYYGIDAFTF
jgi:hypothetical protein